MSTITKDLGRVSIVPKGTWKSAETYDRLDLVIYKEKPYLAKTIPVQGVTPASSTGKNYWIQLYDDSLLQNRIDTAFSSATPSSEAELTDIRNGADGVSYDTAGEAVRTQLNNLTVSIDSKADASRSLAYQKILEDEGTDLDSFVNPGMYNCTYPSRLINYPTTTPGKLIVFGAHTVNNIMTAQLVTTIEDSAPAMYFRTSTPDRPGIWKKWMKVTSTEQLETAIEELRIRTPSYIKVLDSDADLNTYTYSGTYNCNIIDNLKNYPSQKPGKLLVFGTHTGNNVLCVQIVVSGVKDSECSVYFRCSDANNGDNWSNWERLAERDRSAQFLGVIPDNTDLDALVAPSVYNVNDISKVIGWPSNNSGRLVVFGNVSGKSVLTVQIVFDIKGKVYYRISPSNGVWNHWYQTEKFDYARPIKPFSVTSPANNYVFDGDVIDTSVSYPKTEELYGMYDALVEAYPEYITKVDLGKDASNTYDIRCYTIEPYINSGKPEVLFISNIHGDEKNAAISTYYMCKELLEHWTTDPTLQMIFSNVCLRVIPLANPWGYQDGTSRGRLNSEGVNLNRDYPVDWSYVNPGTGDTPNRNSTGLFSMSQVETDIIMNFVEAHKNNALMLINKHDTGNMKSKDDSGDDANRYVGYFSTNDEGSKKVLDGCENALDVVIRATTGSWLNSNTFPNFMGLPLFPTKDAATGGTLNLYSSYIGIPSHLIEMCIGGKSSSANRTDLCKLSVTTDIRSIAAFIINNKDALSSVEQISRKKAYTGDGSGGRIEIGYDPETGEWS